MQTFQKKTKPMSLKHLKYNAIFLFSLIYFPHPHFIFYIVVNNKITAYVKEQKNKTFSGYFCLNTQREFAKHCCICICMYMYVCLVDTTLP